MSGLDDGSGNAEVLDGRGSGSSVRLNPSSSTPEAFGGNTIVEAEPRPGVGLTGPEGSSTLAFPVSLYDLDIGTALADEGAVVAGVSTVRDLRIGAAVGDGGGEAAGAGLGHRSRTDGFRPLVDRGLSVLGDGGAGLCSCELTLTIF